MKAQVLELGGDTLLFGERGRESRIDVPEEIAERRNELVRPESDGGEPDIGTSRSDDRAPPPAGELWYYGAALRCN